AGFQKTPNTIQPPTRINMTGQKNSRTFPMIPRSCSRKRIPNRISVTPQKILSRLILRLSISAHKTACKNKQTQQDDQDWRAIAAQNGQASKECAKNQEHHY